MCRRGRGFTLMELMVVITIIVALCGISYPIYTRIARQAAIHGTRYVIGMVVAACASYQHAMITGTNGRGYNAWTLGQYAADGVTQISTDIDGDPSLYPAGSPILAIRPASYSGPVNMMDLQLPSGMTNSQGQITDRWHQVLHIAYDAKYGSGGVGVWSNGPNRTDDGGTGDDITSWTSTNE